jgi:hypothetical protein
VTSWSDEVRADDSAERGGDEDRAGRAAAHRERAGAPRAH